MKLKCVLGPSLHDPLQMRSMSMSNTQKALVLPVKQSQFTVTTVPIPAPSPDEVLVRIEAAAVNPLEWKIQELSLFVDKYPAILGLDGAGVIVETGSNVTTRKKGDKM